MNRSTMRAAPAFAMIGSLLLSLVACTGDDSTKADRSDAESYERAVVTTVKKPARVAGKDASSMSVAASSALFLLSPVVVLLGGSNPKDVALASSAGVALGVPVLATGSPGVASEMDRLGASIFITYGEANGGWDQFANSEVRLAGPQQAADFSTELKVAATAVKISTTDLQAEVAALDPARDPVVLATSAMAAESGSASPDPAGSSTSDSDSDSAGFTGELPRLKHPEESSQALVLAGDGDDESVPAIATARAAGAKVMLMNIDDPRANADSVAAVEKAKDDTVLALGDDFGSTAVFARNLKTAQSAPQLPGGGQLALPGKLYVAIYGNVLTPALGLLGEQGPEASIKRAKEYAAEYEKVSTVPVVPTFEIIATVATGSAGADGSYSARGRIADIEPWIKKAQAEGVYVILDLQSGREDPLKQAKRYEKLLKYPNVGLALDPEWRLQPDQLPLRQIGYIDADEINRVQDWIAKLVRTNDLPQKIFTLHQFAVGSLPDRSQINFSKYPEVATLLHVDGQGSQPQKQDTWRVLNQQLPQGAFRGWKNFIDEDKPMLTPEQTMEQVIPTPNFISYQ